jgi:hypothetical protein
VLLKQHFLQLNSSLFPKSARSKVLTKAASITSISRAIISRAIILRVIPMTLRLVHARLRVILLHLQHRLPADVVLGAHSGDEIDEEGEDVEGENERDGPFEDGGCIEILFIALDAKS